MGEMINPIKITRISSDIILKCTFRPKSAPQNEFIRYELSPLILFQAPSPANVKLGFFPKCPSYQTLLGYVHIDNMVGGPH